MKKWAVRGLVFFSLASFLAGGLLYQYWTNPETVRQQVLDRLETDFIDVNASLDSARLRIFGGIEIRELRLARKNDLDKSDFLHVPSATLIHDKEQMLDKGLSLRKVELRRPRLRIVRQADGSLNLANLMGPSNLKQPMPTILVQQGSILLEDRLAPSVPALEIKDVSLSVLNDPLPLVVFSGKGTVEGLGTVRINGQMTRGGGPLSLDVQMEDLSIGPSLVQRLAGYLPEAAEHLRFCRARAKGELQVRWNPAAKPALHWSLKGEITDGTLTHARLPWPFDGIRGSFTCTNGHIPSVELHAKAGRTEVTLGLEDVNVLGAASSWLDRLGAVKLDAKHVPIEASLFRYLPPALEPLQREYSPTGLASVNLHMRRVGPGIWKHTGSMLAEEMSGEYLHFRYPVKKIRGKLDWQWTNDFNAPADAPGHTDDRVTLDLSGEAGGAPVHIKGWMEGERGTSVMHLDLWGRNLPVEEALLKALPPRPLKQAREFAPTGLLDFRVLLRRERGKRDISKRYLLHLHDATVCYRVFPLPLQQVSGTLDLRGDSWEFRDFVGKHGGGTIRASGGCQPLPPGAEKAAPLVAHGAPRTRRTTHHFPIGGEEESEAAAPPSRIFITVDGTDLPIDDPLKDALGHERPGLFKAFNTFNLTGKLNFTVQIDDLPNQARDIDVTVGIGGCRMNPAFFEYPLEDVAATVRYADKNVWVKDFRGKHKGTTLHIKNAHAVLPEAGGFWVKLDRLEAENLTFDKELQHALPGSLARLAEMLKPDRPLSISSVLVLQQPAAENSRLNVYWDSMISLQQTTLQGGVEWKDVTGKVSCQGLHNGSGLENLVGNIALDRATVLNQPLTNVHMPFVMRKDSPEVLRIPDLKAGFFGGTLDGEARVEFTSTFRYALLVNVSQVQLEKVGAHNFGKSADLSGLANGGIYLEGESSELEGMKGKGRIDVPSGKMYRLPVLLDLLKWLGLRVPDRTAFETARLRFRIEGPRLHIEELDLYGNAVSVRGDGSMNLDGSDLKLDLNADWGKIMLLLPAGMTDLTREISNQILRVKVRGSLSEVKFEKELIPAVTSPLKKWWGKPEAKPTAAREK